jgi:hypothetical protein
MRYEIQSERNSGHDRGRDQRHAAGVCNVASSAHTAKAIQHCESACRQVRN